MFGDFGAPTGQQPLYSGNDVMVGGVAGGDIMKGFSGDDIMLGHGGFTKFIGGLGFDWGSYELATQGVDVDMNRKEFVAANGAVDAIRDVWQQTEGASGSAFDDNILGDNATQAADHEGRARQRQPHHRPAGLLRSGPGVVRRRQHHAGWCAAATLIIGGGGNDIIDGDACLHVGLTSYYGRRARSSARSLRSERQHLRSGNRGSSRLTTTGLVDQSSRRGPATSMPPTWTSRSINDVMANYDVALFGPDAQGFLTIQHNASAGAAWWRWQSAEACSAVDDGTDRIRNIERLQFADGTVAIDKNGNMISSSFNPIADPNYATLYAPYYDAVPFGTPTITETDPNGNAVDPAVAVVVGDTLHANVATISDFDGISTAVQLPVAVCRRHIRRLDRFHGCDQRGLQGPQRSCSPRGSGCG